MSTVHYFLLGFFNAPIFIEAFQLRPQNAVVKIGQGFELSCEYDSYEIDWYHTPLLTPDERKLKKKITEGYNRSFFTYAIDRVHRLNVTSAIVGHAGTYDCVVVYDQSTTELASAVVVIIDGDPACEMKNKAILVENDRIEMRCTISHYGPENPVMKWTQETAHGHIMLNSTQSTNQNLTTSIQNILADTSVHESQLTCQIHFSKSHPSAASNTPDYNFLWKSPQIRILYGPRNLTVHPRDGVLYASKQANCSAEGYPAPLIEWIHLKTNKTISGSKIAVNEVLGDEEPHVFMCKAINIATKETANITIEFRIVETVAASTDDWNDNTLLVRLLLCALAICLFIILGLIFHIVARKRKERRKEKFKLKAIFTNRPSYIRGRENVPICRFNRYNAPQCVTKVQPVDNDTYLSPCSDLHASCSNTYDEIPDMQALSVHNITYFGMPSTRSALSPSEPQSSPMLSLRRSRDDRLEASGTDGRVTLGGFYESLQRR